MRVLTKWSMSGTIFVPREIMSKHVFSYLYWKHNVQARLINDLYLYMKHINSMYCSPTQPFAGMRIDTNHSLTLSPFIDLVDETVEISADEPFVQYSQHPL